MLARVEQLRLSWVRVGIGRELESGASWNRARVGIGRVLESGASSSRVRVRVGRAFESGRSGVVRCEFEWVRVWGSLGRWAASVGRAKRACAGSSARSTSR